ncbi:glycoside hydrolase family 3 N-terminal domain-containing protein [Rubrivirga sp. S365]|uniref:glycoside hydrolase family 3 protein n=1 Tax=Rubrivirga sp. S365 TaxID=3076080 RepID=UPI0028C9EA78|nr:glycoside hydrolase family 3 N-terminal domain-containing protein [Rubrivirga sp. S365]MDT7856190.1 glycoside hydrolase family 3 N-terminal domain-containing protein [Rubrivirga sp. S365]
MRLALLLLVVGAAPLAVAGCASTQGETAPAPPPTTPAAPTPAAPPPAAAAPPPAAVPPAAPPVAPDAPAAAAPPAPLDTLLAEYAGFESPPAVPEAEAQAWADSVLARMTLREQVAQLFVVELGGARDPAGLAAEGVGGFHVSRRMPPREALAATNRLQRAARLPLLMTADFEWGVGTATSTFTSLPAAMAYGAAGSEELARLGGAVTALEARAMGINVVFAPVADVNNNPLNPIINTRSFGSDPAAVGRLAGAYVRGAQAHGVLATLKHFPGHGNTDTDTHVDFASIGGDWDDLSRTELAAFRGALAARPGVVMTTHLWARALDAEATPATFSRRALTDVLRDSLGFEGLITTDALNMGAIRKHYDAADRVVRPIEAGADLVLMSARPRSGIRDVVQAVERGEIPRAQVAASARRVLLAKARLGLHRQRLTDRARLDRMLTSVRGAAFARALSQASVTVVRPGPLPLRPAQRVALVQLGNFNAGDPMTRLERDLGAGVAVRVSRRGAGRREAARAASGADVAVVALHLKVKQGAPPRLTDAQRRAVEAVQATGTPVVVVVLGNPYAAALVPDAAGVVVAYDETLRTASAVADVLTGRRRATGRLPVEVPGL